MRILFSVVDRIVNERSWTGADVVNSLSRQRNALETFLKACIGLEGSSDLLLETRIW